CPTLANTLADPRQLRAVVTKTTVRPEVTRRGAGRAHAAARACARQSPSARRGRPLHDAALRAGRRAGAPRRTPLRLSPTARRRPSCAATGRRRRGILQPASTRDRTSTTGRSRRRRSEEHTSELQSRVDVVCRLLL